jgi:hypothetical protein
MFSQPELFKYLITFHKLIIMEKNDYYTDLEENKPEEIKPVEIKPMFVEELNVTAIFLFAFIALFFLLQAGNSWVYENTEQVYKSLRSWVHTMLLLKFCLVIFVLLPYGRHHTKKAFGSLRANSKKICFDLTSTACYLFIFSLINYYA